MMNAPTDSHAIVVEKLGKRFLLRKEQDRTLKGTLLGVLRGSGGLRGRGARNDLWALKDVNFEVRHGETFGVIGANGAGKSTLLGVLAGTIRPTEGRLHVEGRVSSLLELGAGFHPDLTGRENVYLNASILGLPRATIAAKFDAIVRFAGLAEFIDSPVKHYSSGMYVRLGFAVAVEVDPDVLLVDEVLAVGDGYFQRKCIDCLRDMRSRGATLVVASHDLHAMRGLCERALWLRGGRTEALGPADQVLGSYEEHLRRRASRESALPGRHGTGEVVVESVRLTDGIGTERHEFRSGETLRVEVRFEARRALESPVMGIAVFRDDGVYCYGPNTRFDGVLAGTYEGRYRLTAEFPDLPLLAGSYQASVAFYDKDHVYAYAWHHRLYPFRVVSDRPDHGVVLLRHRFSVEKLADET